MVMVNYPFFFAHLPEGGDLPNKARLFSLCAAFFPSLDQRTDENQVYRLPSQTV